MLNFILKIPLINQQFIFVDLFFNNYNICFLALCDLLNKPVIGKNVKI